MRSSDRWITPAVVVTGLLTAGVVALGTIAAVTYLTGRGIDPDPMLKLVAQAVTALGSLGTFLVTLAGRRGVAKVERQAGLWASHTDRLTDVVCDVAEAMPRPVPRHAVPEETVEAPAYGAAPAPVGR